MKPLLRSLLVLIAMMSPSIAPATECVDWVRTTFEVDLNAALTGAKFATNKVGLERGIDAVFRAHFARINVPFSKEKVSERVLTLHIDFVGQGFVETFPSPELFSIEFSTNAFERYRYTVEIGPGEAYDVKLVGAATGAGSGKRLYQVAPETQKVVLNELTEIASKPGFRIFDLSYKLQSIMPKTVRARRSLILEFFDGDLERGLRLIKRLDMESSDMVFSSNFLSELELEGFWKTDLAAKLEKLSNLGKEYVKDPSRAVRSEAELQILLKNFTEAKSLLEHGNFADHPTLLKFIESLTPLLSIPARERVEMIRKAFGNIQGYFQIEGKGQITTFALVDFLQRTGALANHAKMETFLSSIEKYHFEILE